MLVITFNYIKKVVRHSTKATALLLTIFMLSGCLGGTVAQQLVRSIATSLADKTVARAMGVEEDEDYTDAQYAAAEKLSSENNAVQRGFTQNSSAQVISASDKRALQLQETEADDFSYMLATASFLPVTAKAEPLPAASIEQLTKVDTVQASEAPQANQLVRVELYNLLIGAEKNAVYDEARLVGTTNLPQKQAWKDWQVGVGAIEQNKKIITFLIPPEFGKLPSGAITMVEIAGAGDLNIARYEPENLKYKRVANIKQAQGF